MTDADRGLSIETITGAAEAGRDGDLRDGRGRYRTGRSGNPGGLPRRPRAAAGPAIIVVLALPPAGSPSRRWPRRAA